MAPSGPIAVYGATGYTGRLVAAEAARRGLDIVLSGRNAERLRAVADLTGVDAPIRPAAVDDASALRHVLADCAAVVNCAGPFSHLGEPVVRAAIETGTHYVDTTGEQPYMKRIADGQDAAARAAGVAVVCAMGFDYLPGDLLCGLTPAATSRCRTSSWPTRSPGRATRGTMHSALEMMKGGDWCYVDGDWRPAGNGPLRGRFAFPEPVGRQAVAKYPCGEIVTVPRHVDVRTITALITTLDVRRPPVAGPSRAVHGAGPGPRAALPAAGSVDAAIDRLPEGPPPEARRAAAVHARRRRPRRGRLDHPGRRAGVRRLRPDRGDLGARRGTDGRDRLRPRGGPRTVDGLRRDRVPGVPRRPRGLVLDRRGRAVRRGRREPGPAAPGAAQRRGRAEETAHGAGDVIGLLDEHRLGQEPGQRRGRGAFVRRGACRAEDPHRRP